MARVKRGITKHKHHKKIIDRAEGYWGGKRKLYKSANEQVMMSLRYAYIDRRNKKRDFRRLWIARISAACRGLGVRYNEFMHGMITSGMIMDRKVLADLAANDMDAFKALVERVTPTTGVA
jgi:large subunit ribosomal protein L20